ALQNVPPRGRERRASLPLRKPGRVSPTGFDRQPSAARAGDAVAAAIVLVAVLVGDADAAGAASSAGHAAVRLLGAVLLPRRLAVRHAGGIARRRHPGCTLVL